MGWRIKTTAVVMVGAAVGVTALYLKDYNVTSVGPVESVAFDDDTAADVLREVHATHSPFWKSLANR